MLAKDLPPCMHCDAHAWQPHGAHIGSLSQEWFRCTKCSRTMTLLSYECATYLLCPGGELEESAFLDWTNEVLLVTIRDWAEKRKTVKQEAWKEFLHGKDGEPGFLERHGVEEYQPNCIRYNELPTQEAKDEVDAQHLKEGTREFYPPSLWLPPIPARLPADCYLAMHVKGEGGPWQEVKREETLDLEVPPDPVRVRHDAYFKKVFDELNILETKEIPNRYGPNPSKNEPWFEFTEGDMEFVVGPRKRVVSISAHMPRGRDLTELRELAEKDRVTYDESYVDNGKGGVLIHAWSQEKVIEYLGILLAMAESVPEDGEDDSEGPNIVPVMDLSTAHMPNSNPDFGEARWVSHEYGWVVWVTDIWKDENELPEWLQPIMKEAYKRDCMMICFDRDAETYKGFETWDW